MSDAHEIRHALSTLEQILLQKKKEGDATVGITSESLSALRKIPAALSQSSRRPAPQPVPPAPSEGFRNVATLDSSPSAPKVSAGEPISLTGQKLPPPESFGTLAVSVENRGRVQIIHPAGDSARDKLNNLFRIARQSNSTPELSTLRDQLVFATGNPQADLMFVGEAPGAEEEMQRKPFVGPAGQKLDQILQAMGLKRDDVYISNIVKFRPKIGDGRFQGNKNRKPTPEEIAAFVKFVRSEIEIIQPRVIVALGGTAAEGLLDQGGSVSAMRGRFFELDGIPVAVTYHPSYLLRMEGESDQERARREKRKVWEDALMVMEKLDMPISDKQRGFFQA